MNAWPTVADAVARLVITGADGGADAMVSVNVAFPVPPVLLAPTVIVGVPLVVGIPLMTPDEPFNVKPAGNGVAVNPVGLLVAVIV